MSTKSKCLTIDSSLYCRKFGAGMYLFYQVFKGEHCFSAPAQCEKEAWRLAYKSLEKEPAND